MYDVFLSYASADRPRAVAVRDALSAASLEVWWDRDVDAGEHWPGRILTALDDARCVVCLYSRHSLESGYVLDEIQRAGAASKLLPVRLAEVEAPFGMGRVQSLDVFGSHGEPQEDWTERVVTAVQRRLRLPHEPSCKEQLQADEPDAAHRTPPNTDHTDTQRSASRVTNIGINHGPVINGDGPIDMRNFRAQSEAQDGSLG